MEATGIATQGNDGVTTQATNGITTETASPQRRRHHTGNKRHRHTGNKRHHYRDDGITTETTASPHPEVLRKKLFFVNRFSHLSGTRFLASQLNFPSFAV